MPIFPVPAGAGRIGAISGVGVPGPRKRMDEKLKVEIEEFAITGVPDYSGWPEEPFGEWRVRFALAIAAFVLKRALEGLKKGCALEYDPSISLPGSGGSRWYLRRGDIRVELTPEEKLGYEGCLVSVNEFIDQRLVALSKTPGAAEGKREKDGKDSHNVS